MDQQQSEVNKQSALFMKPDNQELVFLHLVKLEDNQPVNFNLSVKAESSVPFLHPDQFAKLIGLSSGVVGGWIDNGYIPTVKTGKYRMINLVKLTADLQGAS